MAEEPGVPHVEHDNFRVPELLIRFVRATHEMNRCEPAHGEGLSAQQIRALLYLIQHQGSTVKELSSALSVSEARASRLADAMVESGHVVHERDTIDRRLVRLHVTPLSADRARHIYRERTGALHAALADASERDIAVFTRLLARVVNEWEALARRSADQSAKLPV
ncbi:MAG: hypothetical protein PVSMB7_29510 [Chloroflexota bacterium]